jgi:hypothetical protein
VIYDYDNVYAIYGQFSGRKKIGALDFINHKLIDVFSKGNIIVLVFLQRIKEEF